ncbi:MAG: DUF853 family protein [Candidatus Brocadiales bacterium]|nr:DUF853 family protein [Candidatus Brocadiales bacterium]
MNSECKNYFFSPKFGSSGILRISKDFAAEFEGQAIIQGRAQTPDNQELPIVVNINNRTLDGLKTWLISLKEQEYHSFRILIKKLNPILLYIEPSDETPTIEEERSSSLNIPEEGLYIGRKLEDNFNELIHTNSPFVVQESDLLTHVFICGATGTGKTVLGKIFLEEVARKKIPVIAIDLKGDISSLALILSGEYPDDFIPWVTPSKNKSREEIAAHSAEEHKCNLIKWGFNHKFVEVAKKNFAVNIFTPRSNDGFRLAISAFPEPPENIQEMRKADPDAYDSLIDFCADQFVARLAVNKKLADKTKGYVFEIIKICFSRDLLLHGYDGVKRVLEEIKAPHMGIDQIGGLSTNEYISVKDRENLANAVNALLTGAGRRIYEGWPVNINKLIDPQYTGSKTPISIINLKHLEFNDQAYVVGHIAYLIWFWMRRLQGTYDPRLVFYIDEIGGGGGKVAFFPSIAKSPCKPALNLLLRQGRAQGVCCIFSTQNPGDIDYKGLGNCGTWIVGQLRTRRDRSKIEQGAGDAELEFESAKRYLPSLSTGQFVLRTPSTNWSIIQERWLLSLHRPLSSEELQQLKSVYENYAKLLISEAEERFNKSDLINAERLLREVIQNYPFSSLTSNALILLARVLISGREYAKARLELQQVLKRWVTDEELSEAKFLLGKCYEHENEFEKAKEAYMEAQKMTQNTEIKEQSQIHGEYCSARATWPTLGLVGKIIWWIIGRNKPDEDVLVQLQFDDERILTSIHQSILLKVDFSLPNPVDYEALAEFSEAAQIHTEALDGERLKVEKWAQDQTLRLQDLLSKGNLSECTNIANRIVQRLSDSGTPAPHSVLETLKKLNNESGRQTDQLRSKVIQTEARQFEYEIARLLKLMGYEAHATKATGDDGVDVFAEKDGEKVIVQCKKWEKPVGRAVVDELAGTAARHKATRAILATTSSFSLDAEQTAREHNIALWDFFMLCRLFQKFGQRPDS